MMTEVWVFTDLELDTPEKCKRNDVFTAKTLDGEIITTDRLGGHPELDTDSLFKDQDEDGTSIEPQPADNWRIVVIDNNGNFVAFDHR